MGLWKKLFGSGSSSSKKKSASKADDAAVDEVLEMLEDDASAADLKTNFTARSASPKEVLKYIFQQLLSGTPPDELHKDLVRRGFARKTADSYIDLIQKVIFKRS